MKILVYFVTKQATLMWLTVLSLPLLLVFPGQYDKMTYRLSFLEDHAGEKKEVAEVAGSVLETNPARLEGRLKNISF